MVDMQPTLLTDVDGDKWWILAGKIHRIDGPAVEWQDGDFEWYLDNNKLTLDEWLAQNQTLNDEEKIMMKLKYG
jgi:hypothetical protein